jgi:PRTRC genetic system protein C
MSIQVQTITRRYLYNGMTLPDIPGHEPKDVRDIYSAQFPELLSADIEVGDIANGIQEVTFKRAVGTKG